jgi:hypothetical protein
LAQLLAPFEARALRTYCVTVVAITSKSGFTVKMFRIQHFSHLRATCGHRRAIMLAETFGESKGLPPAGLPDEDFNSDDFRDNCGVWSLMSH